MTQNEKKWYCFLALLVVGVPLFYALYTDHRWEDYYITYKASRNLAVGNGLGFFEGVRTHSFTSPLGVLLPSFLLMLSGSDEFTIWAFRILSIGMFFFGWSVLYRYFTEVGISLFSRIVFSLLIAFEAKVIAFSTNGMETGLMLAALGCTMVCHFKGISTRPILTGLSWAFLMWTRPDGCIFIATLGLTTLIFSDREVLKQNFLGMLKAAGICTLVYLPWFAGVWWYYGSPVPVSLQAKSPLYPFGHFMGVLKNFYWKMPESFSNTWQPIYHHLGGWPEWIVKSGGFFSILSLVYFLLPSKDKVGKQISLTLFLLSIYTSYIVTFPWYFPQLVLLSAIVLMRVPEYLSKNTLLFILGAFVVYFSPDIKLGLDYLMSYGRESNYIGPMVIYGTIAILSLWYILNKNRLMDQSQSSFIGKALVLFHLGITVGIFILTSIQMKIHMDKVEWGNMKKIGLWLKENVPADENIFLEPLGYIGYFSQAKVVSFPGLCSPEVVEIRKKHQLNMRNQGFAKVVSILKPDWVVMRPEEQVSTLKLKENRDSYEFVKEFNVRQDVLDAKAPAGEGYLLCDSVYVIYKRKEAI